MSEQEKSEAATAILRGFQLGRMRHRHPHL